MRFPQFPHRSRRGQALVETALVLPVVIMVLLLGIDLGRVFFTTVDLRNAAHEATMWGGTHPATTCADPTGTELRDTIDRQMNRLGEPNAAICGAMPASGAAVDRVYVAMSVCERQGGPPCGPGLNWQIPYPPDADLRYAVRLQYRFQPILPLVGLLSGNGVGGSLPISVENRSPILVSYGN